MKKLLLISLVLLSGCANTVVLDEDVQKCEEAGGRYSMIWYEENQEYIISCRTIEKVLFRNY